MEEKWKIDERKNRWRNQSLTKGSHWAVNLNPSPCEVEERKGRSRVDARAKWTISCWRETSTSRRTFHRIKFLIRKFILKWRAFFAIFNEVAAASCVRFVSGYNDTWYSHASPPAHRLLARRENSCRMRQMSNKTLKIMTTWEAICRLLAAETEMKCEMDENVNFIVNVRILER